MPHARSSQPSEIPSIPERGVWSATSLLDEISAIGRDPVRGGYSRHAFDDSDLLLRAWFVAKATELGLSTYTDQNTNLWAWWGSPGANAVGVGSHLDSVPGGGAFDGPLGVVSGLAAIAALKQRGYEPATAIALVVFTEEEGSRFGIACLGSRLMTGRIGPEQAAALLDRTGTRFRAAATAAGIDADQLGRDEHALGRLGCFVELHVEQGRAMTDLDAPIALATSILAHGRWKLSFSGSGNHAGTTTMRDRNDPMLAAARTVQAAREATIGEADEVQARATVGRMEIVPGGTNAIASRVDVWLDVRALSEENVRRIVASIVRTAQRASEDEGCSVELLEESFTPSVEFDRDLRKRLDRVLGDVPEIPTGAGHDAGILAADVPTAMIFVRNPTGVSHSPAESAAPEDCERGVEAMVAVLRELA